MRALYRVCDLLPTVLTVTMTLSTGAARAAPPRTVLHGGSVFTGDPSATWAQAITIEGDRIVAVGRDADLLAQVPPHTTRIDLQGHLVVPGINDAHVHVVVPEGDYLNTPAFIP